MANQNKKRKGFTLVELLVVIAILAILATVSIVGYTAFITKANQSNATTEANQIKEQISAAVLAGEGYELGSIVVETTGTDNAKEYTITPVYVAPVASGSSVAYQLAVEDTSSKTGYVAMTTTNLGSALALVGSNDGTAVADLKDLLGDSKSIILVGGTDPEIDCIYYEYVNGTTTVMVQIPFDTNTAVSISEKTFSAADVKTTDDTYKVAAVVEALNAEMATKTAGAKASAAITLSTSLNGASIAWSAKQDSTDKSSEIADASDSSGNKTWTPAEAKTYTLTATVSSGADNAKTTQTVTFDVTVAQANNDNG